MATIILCLIFGLAITVEKSYINLYTDKFERSGRVLTMVALTLQRKFAVTLAGPVASIFYQGLSRMDQGLDDVVEINHFGSVQMGQLESGLTWIALFICIGFYVGIP